MTGEVSGSRPQAPRLNRIRSPCCPPLPPQQLTSSLPDVLRRKDGGQQEPPPTPGRGGGNYLEEDSAPRGAVAREYPQSHTSAGTVGVSAAQGKHPETQRGSRLQPPGSSASEEAKASCFHVQTDLLT